MAIHGMAKAKAKAEGFPYFIFLLLLFLYFWLNLGLDSTTILYGNKEEEDKGAQSSILVSMPQVALMWECIANVFTCFSSYNINLGTF